MLGAFYFLFTSVFLSGCVNVNEANESSPPLKATISIDGLEHQIEKGGYQWESKTGSSTKAEITDHASPNQMAEEIKPISTRPNEQVDIEVEDQPNIKLYLWNGNGRVKEIIPENNQFTLLPKKGEYIYEVFAEWPNGNISYTFVTEIK